MVTKIDIGNDGIQRQEWQQIKAELQEGKDVQLTDGDKLLYTVSADQLNDLQSRFSDSAFSGAGENIDPSVVLTAEEQNIKSQMDQVQEAIRQLSDSGAEKEQVQAKQAELANLIEQANSLFKQNGRASFNLTPYNKAAGQGEKTPYSGKAQVSTSSQSGPQGQQTPYSGKAQAATTFAPPAGWGAQTSGAMPKFNTAAYAQAMAMESDIMSSWDQVNKNTNRGKQLMQLFFHFARMAESGDMTAMYQFMKFITYIVSKDKAKQQIEMGKKLISLQEKSREWSNKLMEVQGNSDSTDPSSSAELMKTITMVKSETDAIATSQKLISQMMEEFAQVVETLTNTTKAALDTAGRIQRTVSTMR